MSDQLGTAVCYRHPDRATRLSCSECGRPICVDCSHDAPVGQKCPECAKPEGRHRVVDARRTTGPRAGLTGAPVTTTILIVTVGLFVIGMVSPDAREWLLANLAHFNPAIAAGELWRMLTAALLHSHSNLLHILFNMYLLYALGPELERRVGSAPFALFYAAAAAAGSAFVFFLGEPATLAVGASGAIFGLFGAWAYVGWKTRHTNLGRARFNQLAVLVAINLALPFFVPGIAWQAHVGGLLAGVFMAWLWGLWAVGSDRPELRRSIVAGAVLAFSIGAVAVLGPSQALAMTDCSDLARELQASNYRAGSARVAATEAAVDRYFAAAELGYSARAELCALVANVASPSAQDALSSLSDADLDSIIETE
jgi:membrane associated rhomboid family serine protease